MFSATEEWGRKKRLRVGASRIPGKCKSNLCFLCVNLSFLTRLPRPRCFMRFPLQLIVGFWFLFQELNKKNFLWYTMYVTSIKHTIVATETYIIKLTSISTHTHTHTQRERERIISLFEFMLLKPGDTKVSHMPVQSSYFDDDNYPFPFLGLFLSITQ